jgi:hypothetical protein
VRVDRTDVDDHPSASLFAEFSDNASCEQEWSSSVYSENPVEDFARAFFDAGARKNPCIVHENIKPAKPVDDFAYETAWSLRIGEILNPTLGSVSDELGGRSDRFGVATMYCDGQTASGKSAGTGKTNA